MRKLELDYPILPTRIVERSLAAVKRAVANGDIEIGNESEVAIKAFLNGALPTVSALLTPAEAAQEIIYDAFEASGKSKIQLAKKALQVYPDCADAYSLMAEEAGTYEEALVFFQKGLDAAKRTLPREAESKRFKGDLWELLEARPYMRARFGVAVSLWRLNKLDSAIGHGQALLSLDEEDHQGVRHYLMAWYLAAGRDTEAGALLGKYPYDAYPVMAFAAALLSFRTRGRCPKTSELFRRAVQTEPYVLLVMISDDPASPNPGKDPYRWESAYSVLDLLSAAILRTPHALAWFRGELEALHRVATMGAGQRQAM